MIGIDKIEIGTRLRFKGNSIIPPLSGTVIKIYPAFDKEEKDAVLLRPDELPENWPYTNYAAFTPLVEDCGEE